MRNRVAHFAQVKDKDQEKLVEITCGNNKEKISCLDKKAFDKKADGDKVVGYIHTKNKRFSGREYATLKDALPKSGKNLDIYSKKKLWEGVVGYACTYDGEYVAVTRSYLVIILIILALLLALAGVGIWKVVTTKQTVPAPNFSQVVRQDDEYDITAHVILPEGKTTFDGTVYSSSDENKGSKDNPYSGKATIRVTLMVNGVEKVLVDDTQVDIEKGQLPDVYIDFTKLDFELTPGTYYGTVTITYSDGSVVKKPIRIVILDSTQGSAGIGYSDQVVADKASGTITLSLTYDQATTDCVVQVVTKINGNEVLLGQSNLVSSGQTVASIVLDSTAASQLQAGTYSGVIRLYFDDTGSEASTNFKTDIDVDITVQ